MAIVDVGSGPPLVLVPGAQGRWEWMRPAVEALARRCRVVTYSLADAPPEDGRGSGAPAGFSSCVRQVGDALDAAGVDRAAVCGVSFGGLIAAAFAARHPERTTGLILVSALPPGWRPDARARFYLRAPRLLSPLFVLASLRMYPEIAAAYPTAASALAGACRHGINALTHPFSPAGMAWRVGLVPAVDPTPELARLNVRTLVITGEDRLDRVVPPALTREYLRIWPHASAAVLAHTGHLGLITRADEFARVVCDFVGAPPRGEAERPLPRGAAHAAADSGGGRERRG
jgi:pimeloyl-ACP methyl ester carboxylesterase